MKSRCSMTGNPINDLSDGIYEDGEWISWGWINEQLYEQELKAKYPNADLEVIEVFEELVNAVESYKHVTGRYLSIFGELGELFSEITFGIDRHKPCSQGSDGRLDNDFVEVKTITPEKSTDKVQVKRSGHFNKLVVVKISENSEYGHLEFQARMLDRKLMSKGSGKVATVSWSSIQTKDV